MRLSALVLIGGLLGGCAASNLGRGLNVAVIGSGVADVVTTHYALERGGRELHPWGQTELRRWLLKSVGVSSVIGAAHLLDRKGHPILAHVLRGAIAAVYTWAAVHNHGVNR